MISTNWASHATHRRAAAGASRSPGPGVGVSVQNVRALAWNSHQALKKPVASSAIIDEASEATAPPASPAGPGSPMNLLGHVGRDTAGALQLLPPGIASDDAAERIGEAEQLLTDHLVDRGRDIGDLEAHITADNIVEVHAKIPGSADFLTELLIILFAVDVIQICR